MEITKNNSDLCVCTNSWRPCVNGEKGKLAAEAWEEADIRGIRRLQHLEAILLLCCGQVRCTELNSPATMAKRAAETKEGYPCFLTPSLLVQKSPGAPREPHQDPYMEAMGWRMATYPVHLWHQLTGTHSNMRWLTLCLTRTRTPGEYMNAVMKSAFLSRKKKSLSLSLSHWNTLQPASLCLCISAPPSASYTTLGTWTETAHLQVNYTFCWVFFSYVGKSKNGKRAGEGKGAPGFFSSL